MAQGKEFIGDGGNAFLFLHLINIFKGVRLIGRRALIGRTALNRITTGKILKTLSKMSSFFVSLFVISGRRRQEQIQPWRKNSSEKPTWRSANR